MSHQPMPVLEVAVFTVRAPESFPAIQRQTHDLFAALDGHRTGLRLRGMTDGLFADLVAWASLEAARQASNTAREDPRFAALSRHPSVVAQAQARDRGWLGRGGVRACGFDLARRR